MKKKRKFFFFLKCYNLCFIYFKISKQVLKCPHSECNRFEANKSNELYKILAIFFLVLTLLFVSLYLIIYILIEKKLVLFYKKL